jgi:hypothetical protein
VSPFSLTCCLTERSTVKFVKKGFGDKEIDAILQRLDRLTQAEARTTAAQTLEVVHSLVRGMRVVIDREQFHSADIPPSIEYILF